MTEEKKKQKVNFKGVSILLFVVALVCTVLANVIIPKYDIASSFKLPLMIVSAVVLMIALFLTVKKASSSTTLLNAVLAIVMVLGCVAVPKMEEKEKNIFQEPAKKSQTTMNFYALTSEYKSNHSSLFEDTASSDNILDYANKTFITQSQFDSANTENAISQIEAVLEATPNVTSKDTVYDAIKAFYNGEGEVLVLNDAFVSALKTIKAFKNFDNDTVVLSSLKFGEEEVQEAPEPVSDQQPFAVYVAGNDTRASGLTTVGRTDVDMIMVVNPTSRQILLVSIPRDYYIENPGLSDGMDKLTHLGNQGIRNTLDGINRKFNLNLTDYLCTNFTHFEALVDALGGVTIDNPYTFDAQSETAKFHYEAGVITLNGEEALAYSRERYSLANGDYGRNEHQGIVMQAILEKVQQNAAAGDKAGVLAALSANFLTNVNINDLYNLYTSSSDVAEPWQYIRYHLGGTGTMAGTVSMGMNRMLYVCQPFESQVQFTTDLVNRMLNGETISEDPLPDESSTSYIPN